MQRITDIWRNLVRINGRPLHEIEAEAEDAEQLPDRDQ